ncbi:hypothetical protein A3Q56_07062, partial [Intoshia linei]
KTFIHNDYIFLWYQSGYDGINAWLDAYHGHDLLFVGEKDSITKKLGSLIFGINIISPNSHSSNVDIHMVGDMGQVTNLDIVNIAVIATKNLGQRPTIFNRYDHPFQRNFNGQIYSIFTMIKMIFTQSIGLSTSVHGSFLQYSVESLTMVFGTRSTKDTFNSIQIIEIILRSVNNMPHRFNRSFYFYLMISLNRFISIQEYMVSIILILSPLILKMISINRKMDTFENMNTLYLTFSLVKKILFAVSSGLIILLFPKILNVSQFLQDNYTVMKNLLFQFTIIVLILTIYIAVNSRYFFIHS